MSRIEAENLVLVRGGQRVLDGVSLHVDGGELLGLVGPNGAGKTSLLKCLACLLPCAGDVRLDGVSLAALSPRERATRLAYLGQDGRLGWALTLVDFVALGRLPHRPRWGAWRLCGEDEAAIDAAIAVMRIDPLRFRRVDHLSGGECARARLARALAVGATVLLADEPVAALDPYHQLNVMELLARQCAAGATVITALHDLTLASRFCHRVLLLDRGRAVAHGEPRHVLTPRNLQRVYHISAMTGEHHNERYVMPWRCQPNPD
ncbi:MAG: ABC transporter ATP-binding protein [Candidatus Accumulibacter sp.]|jgi:iron complex transport system ATP-binding protein|nr:ABC transporter ATP-binding protein [Accumulibacter sp.]